MRYLFQQAIADMVPKRIVDRLEPVEVDHQERTPSPRIAGLVHGIAQRLVQHQAIGQFGQRVVARQIGDFLG